MKRNLTRMIMLSGLLLSFGRLGGIRSNLTCKRANKVVSCRNLLGFGMAFNLLSGVETDWGMTKISIDLRHRSGHVFADHHTMRDETSTGLEVTISSSKQVNSEADELLSTS